jgi:DNA-binding transcriptional ArsR family regulator
MPPLRTIDDPRYVKAMSHPLRVRILARLAERTASPNELAEWLDAPLGTVAYHVRTLRRLGLIELRRETRVRGAVQHHYRALPRPLLTDDAWAAAPPIAKQALVGSTLQVIDEHARASAAAGGFDHSDAHITRTLLHLDEEGWQELSRACTRLLEDVERIEGEAADRLAADSDAHRARQTGLVMMLFEAARLAGEEVPERRRSRPAHRHARGGEADVKR